jgi:hypothetical protein
VSLFNTPSGGAPSPYWGAASTGLNVAGIAGNTVAQYSAGKFNARMMEQEHDLSINQGAAGETAQIARGRATMGNQVAAFGGAGVGYGGSAKTAMDLSAVNQEMDALNTKYKGTIAGYGYGVQADIDRQSSARSAINGSLLAGSALLKGLGPTYSVRQQDG